VSAEKAQRVIGWVRQPFNMKPQLGQTVNIRRTAMGQPTIAGKIVQVGSQLEPITSYLLPPNAQNQLVDMGLPFLVSLPADSKLTPGEPVVLTFPSKSASL
jgi:hypothetical protein